MIIVCVLVCLFCLFRVCVSCCNGGGGDFPSLSKRENSFAGGGV